MTIPPTIKFRNFKYRIETTELARNSLYFQHQLIHSAARSSTIAMCDTYPTPDMPELNGSLFPL